ncbi:hypothetical protein CBR_g36392 [Chara braunii]|uniref:Uncharacterized protein n=1 Tax=Chara braunii TaxID=69332 RepID=A0A388LKK6_CHABU|nr:hypothetical protein CBR_g36392 [Chara braunii]|eukprot:GBG82866.1 hypothetical protein CBR_g36392 [Chara braunii]
MALTSHYVQKELDDQLAHLRRCSHGTAGKGATVASQGQESTLLHGPGPYSGPGPDGGPGHGDAAGPAATDQLWDDDLRDAERELREQQQSTKDAKRSSIVSELTWNGIAVSGFRDSEMRKRAHQVAYLRNAVTKHRLELKEQDRIIDDLKSKISNSKEELEEWMEKAGHSSDEVRSLLQLSPARVGKMLKRLPSRLLVRITLPSNEILEAGRVTISHMPGRDIRDDKLLVTLNDDGREARVRSIVKLEGRPSEGAQKRYMEHVMHDDKLVVPETRTKSSLGLVLLGYADLVISATKIDLREEMVASEAVKQIIRMRHGIVVFDRVVVETAVVNTETKGAVLLAIEEDRGTPWGSTRFNEALTKQLVKLALEFLSFGNRKAIWGTILNVIVGLEMDVVLDIAHGRNTIVGDGWWENIVIPAKEGTNARRQGRKKGVKFLGSGDV